MALQNRADRFHKVAREFPLHGDRFLIPWEVWVEYVEVLMRVLPANPVEQALSSTLAGPFEVRKILDARDFLGIAERAQRIRAHSALSGGKPMSIFDVVVCSIAERYREAILTFDQGIVEAVRSKLFPGARIA